MPRPHNDIEGAIIVNIMLSCLLPLGDIHFTFMADVCSAQYGVGSGAESTPYAAVLCS